MSFKRAAAENGFISSPSKNFRGSQPHLLCHKVILQVIRGNYTMSLYRTVQKYIFRLANFCPADASETRTPHRRKYPLALLHVSTFSIRISPPPPRNVTLPNVSTLCCEGINKGASHLMNMHSNRRGHHSCKQLGSLFH